MHTIHVEDTPHQDTHSKTMKAQSRIKCMMHMDHNRSFVMMHQVDLTSYSSILL